MGNKPDPVLTAVFDRPTRRNILFRDFEALVRRLGGEVREREGSRVSFRMNGRILNMHRPHPGKEMLPYQVAEAREWFRSQGVAP